jgi:hypothetical protein
MFSRQDTLKAWNEACVESTLIYHVVQVTLWFIDQFMPAYWYIYAMLVGERYYFAI